MAIPPFHRYNIYNVTRINTRRIAAYFNIFNRLSPFIVTLDRELKIYLPLIRTTEDTSSAEPTRQTDLPGGKEHILFVDDESDLVATTGSMLKYLGYTVTSCTASEEALALFVKNPLAYDLLLTDHTMPKMTGEVLAGEVHRLRPEMPILLYTGSLLPSPVLRESSYSWSTA